MKLAVILVLLAVACLPIAYAVPCTCVNGICDNVVTGLCIPGTCAAGFGGDNCDQPLLNFVDCPAGTMDAIVLALRTFYNNMGGPLWTQATGWNNLASTNPCADSWFGISCNTPCSIESIILSNNNLAITLGTQVDISSLVALHNLRVLDLSNNGFGGPLDARIGFFLQLQSLLMANNEMTGEIPYTINAMPFLKYVDLSGNQFTGPLPSFAASAAALQYVYLNDNYLQGPWTTQLLGNAFLRSIWLHHNCMDGEIPFDVSLLPLLTELRAASCGLSVAGIPQVLRDALAHLLVLTVGGSKACDCPPLT